MPGHQSTTHAHPTTMAEARDQNSLDTRPTSIHAQSQPLPSHPVNSPPHFTAGNSFGPYLFKGLTTNHPHPQFLGSLSNPTLVSSYDPTLVKLGVPNYLFANRSHIRELPCNNAPVDPFRYYLCASLARHHAYREAYLSKGTTPLYRTSYENFHRRFTKALQSLLNNETKPAKEQTDLVTAEQDLTHESFHIWPHLFDRTFSANHHLLSSIDAKAPTLLHLLRLHHHPLPFLHALKSHLQTHWIDLADAADILDRRHPRYRTWCVLERRKGELEGKVSAWIGDARDAMLACDDDDDDDDDEEEARGSNWRTQVDHLRAFETRVRGEPVRVWDDALDGLGLDGWKRVLAGRLEEAEGEGGGVDVEGVGVENVVPVGWDDGVWGDGIEGVGEGEGLRWV